MSNNVKGTGKRRAKRVNSEPHIESITALRAKDRMVTSLSEGVQQEYAQNSNQVNSGLITKIKGLKTEIYKRVSRVYLSDEDVRAVNLDNDSPVSTSLRTTDTDTMRDPNVKPSQQSMHDVVKQLQIRRLGSNAQTIEHERPAVRNKHLGDHDNKKGNQSDSEIYRVLEALKNGKAVHEIECTRTIVQKTVDLKVSDTFTTNRHRYGAQFGLRIVGGKKTAGGMLCAFIASIVPGSPAGNCTSLQEGDMVLKWNNITLIGLTFEEVQQILDDCDTLTLVVSNFLRGSYRRYKPRSSNTATNGSVESILRGTTQKWISLARRGAMNRQLKSSEQTESQESQEAERINSDAIKIELRVVYVAMEQRLSVHLIQGGNIPYREGVDGLDLFCKLYLTPDQSTESKKRSKTALRTYSPYWNQHFEYQPIFEDQLTDKKLELSLWAHHWLQKHELLGQIEIDLKDKNVLSGHPSWYLLNTPSLESPSIKLDFDAERKASMAKLKGASNISYRTTFSTFDSKKVVPEIRRSASDITKPTKSKFMKPALKSSSTHLGGTGDEDSSDNVFTPQTLHNHLSNIKESDGQRPPITDRCSPRRRPKVIRNKSGAKDLIQPKVPYSSESDEGKYRRAIRSNSEDFTVTKHRVLPKPPSKSKKDISMTLPNKRTVSPFVSSKERLSITPTQVILTAPSSDDCGNSSSDSLSPPNKYRPVPEGSKRQTLSLDLGPGQIPPITDSFSSHIGTLELSLSIDKNVLTIHIIKAFELPLRSSGIPPDTYVKTYVLLEYNKSHKEKTSIVRACQNPVYNESITYIVNPTNKKAQITVWDVVGALRRNIFMGEILIDLNYVANHGPCSGQYKLLPLYSHQPP